MQLRSTIHGRFPFFLLLLPAFIFLHIEKDYSSLINYASGIKEILILFAAPIAVYAFSWLLYRSVPKANLFSLVFLFFFFFFGDIKDFLSKNIPGSFLQSYTVLIPLSIVIISISGIAVKRATGDFSRLFGFVHLALLLFIAVDLVAMIWPAKKGVFISDMADTPPFQPCKTCATPDIYYILLDEYTSSRNMQEQFGYDNSAIDNYLEGEGFTIIQSSTSNYNLAAFSMSSIFSLNYLATVDSSKDFYLKNYLPGVELMYKSPLPGIFATQGYQVYNNSIFDIRNFPSLTPLTDMWGSKALFQQHNMFRKTDNDIGWQFPSWAHIRFSKEIPVPEEQDTRDSLALQKLFSIAREKSAQPKFVYTHLLSPHFPYIRDSSGIKITTPKSGDSSFQKKEYIGQVIYTNRLIRRMVDSIKANNGSSPVIIIQGDHGYRPATRKIDASQFRNFNAMYFPDSLRPPAISDSMSSVNTFRFVLNQLFHAHYPLLENRHYFLKYWPL